MAGKLKHETPSEHMKTFIFCERCCKVFINENIKTQLDIVLDKLLQLILLEQGV